MTTTTTSYDLPSPVDLEQMRAAMQGDGPATVGALTNSLKKFGTQLPEDILRRAMQFPDYNRSMKPRGSGWVSTIFSTTIMTFPRRRLAGNKFPWIAAGCVLRHYGWCSQFADLGFDLSQC